MSEFIFILIMIGIVLVGVCLAYLINRLGLVYRNNLFVP